jgi:hypothetical protein
MADCLESPVASMTAVSLHRVRAGETVAAYQRRSASSSLSDHSGRARQTLRLAAFRLAFLPMARFAASDRLGSARREAIAATIVLNRVSLIIRGSAFLRAEFAATERERLTAFVASSGDRFVLETSGAMRAARGGEDWQRRRQRRDESYAPDKSASRPQAPRTLGSVTSTLQRGVISTCTPRDISILRRHATRRCVLRQSR